MNSDAQMSSASFGVVVIGRNEGERLRICLESVRANADQMVYVDSGSTDDSVSMARAMGAELVNLDMSRPFTAARARNAGFERLLELTPTMPFVQFIDGDCEVVAGWLERAVEFLQRNTNVAAVCGWRRERYPGRSIYNTLCDAEWNRPAGQTRACGGDVMMRVSALKDVGGYDPDLIAGEEPELCVRLRQNGWHIWRLGAVMTLHDAAITRYRQWWKRTVRGGYAFAQGAQMHGTPPEYHCVRPMLSVLFWGALLPLLIILAASTWSWGWLLIWLYPIQIVRLAIRDGIASKLSWLQATFFVMGKFPEMLGAATFLLHRVMGRTGKLIEYKSAS